MRAKSRGGGLSEFVENGGKLGSSLHWKQLEGGGASMLVSSSLNFNMSNMIWLMCMHG
jgi:hypothetical protein